jgi:hypothetical protein
MVKNISEKWLLQGLKGYGRTTATLILGGQVSRIMAKEYKYQVLSYAVNCVAN